MGMRRVGLWAGAMTVVRGDAWCPYHKQAQWVRYLRRYRCNNIYECPGFMPFNRYHACTRAVVHHHEIESVPS